MRRESMNGVALIKIAVFQHEFDMKANSVMMPGLETPPPHNPELKNMAPGFQSSCIHYRIVQGNSLDYIQL